VWVALAAFNEFIIRQKKDELFTINRADLSANELRGYS
jgi:hypothetical protein